MKRLITFAVMILTAVCMAACSVSGKGDTTKPNGLDSSFQAAVSIVLDDLNAEGTVRRIGSGNWEIEFSSPNTLSGVKLNFCDGNVTASYKGLNFSVPQSALPVKAMMLNIISAVDDLAANEKLTGTEEDGMLKINGTLEGGDYTLTVDSSGNIASFEMPNNKLTVTFSDVTPIQPQESTSEPNVTDTTAASTDVSETETTASAESPAA